MGIFTNSWPTELIILLSTIILVSYLYLTRNFNYWKKRGIPYLRPTPLLGNIGDCLLLKTSFGILWKQIYETSKGAYIGSFICDKPVLFVRSPELIKTILVKEFNKFNDRNMFENSSNEPIGSSILFALKNTTWHKYRKKLSPVFSSAKLKLMNQFMELTGKEMVHYIRKSLNYSGSGEIELKKLSSNYAADVITTTCIGIDANSFKDENSEMTLLCRRILDCTNLFRGISMSCYFIAPSLVKLFKLKFVDKTCSNFLRNIFWKNAKIREESSIVRNDLMEYLLKIKDEENIKDLNTLEADRIVAQVAQFFMAGYETIAGAISFGLYELARTTEVQKKLREEIKQKIQENGTITFKILTNEMPYLDMVLQEILRKYPTLPFLDRLCVEDFKIPDSNHVIEKGMPVYMSIMGLHYDPEHFPDPHKFDPERFTEENKNCRHKFVYMPYGAGPRNCIGARYGNIAIMTALTNILSEYEVEVCSRTVPKINFTMTGFTLSNQENLWVKFTKIND